MKININILCVFEVARSLEKVASFRQKVARLFRKVARFPTKVARFFPKRASSQNHQHPKRKEVINMDKVIDFISIKKQKQDEKLHKLFQKANSLQEVQEIDKLVEEKTLAVQDHKLFLAFLKYLELKGLEPKTVFKEVLQLPKFQFEARYQMNWQSVVQLCFTFLAILKENDPEQYLEFIVTN